jgi:hypothetical protein
MAIAVNNVRRRRANITDSDLVEIWGAAPPVDTPGALVFKGYGMTMGYYAKRQETAASYDAGTQQQ